MGIQVGDDRLEVLHDQDNNDEVCSSAVGLAVCLVARKEGGLVLLVKVAKRRVKLPLWLRRSEAMTEWVDLI